MIRPTGERTRTFYRTTRAVADSMRIGAHGSQRVKFSYTADNQVRSVTEPGGLPDSVTYDAGNYVVTYSQKGNDLHIERTMFGKGAVMTASKRAEISDWLRKAGSDAGKLIVLKAPVHSVASH